MKQVKHTLWVILFYTFLFSGCSAVAFYPFFTKDKVIEYPEVVGKWKLQTTNKISELRCEFANGEVEWKYNLMLTNRKERVAEYEVTFFEIDRTIFADFILKRGNVDVFAGRNLVEMHTVAKVIRDKNKCEFIGLNISWLKKELERRPHLIKHIRSEDRLLITANSRQLVRFLKRLAHDSEVFAYKFNVTLLKVRN